MNSDQISLEDIPEPHVEIWNDLRTPLIALGDSWAKSPHRPKPKPHVLAAWDKFLAEWLHSGLPLILRDSGRRNEDAAKTGTGRTILFSDNSPANWMFGLALQSSNYVPDMRNWTSETVADFVPLTFLTKGQHAKRDLNKKGWKVCHIKPVSDRKRGAIEKRPMKDIEEKFMRFLSPRNVFLIPKVISGAGELKEVIDAVAREDGHPDWMGRI